MIPIQSETNSLGGITTTPLETAHAPDISPNPMATHTGLEIGPSIMIRTDSTLPTTQMHSYRKPTGRHLHVGAGSGLLHLDLDLFGQVLVVIAQDDQDFFTAEVIRDLNAFRQSLAELGA